RWRLVFISAVIATTALRITSEVKASTRGSVVVSEQFMRYYLEWVELIEPLEQFHSLKPLAVRYRSFARYVRRSSMTRQPKASTVRVSPGSTTVVEAASSIIAGPSMTFP